MGLVNFQMYLYTFMKKYKPVPHHAVLYCFSLEQLSAWTFPGMIFGGGGGLWVASSMDFYHKYDLQ